GDVMHFPRVHSACLIRCSAVPSSSISCVVIPRGSIRSLSTTVVRFKRERDYYDVLGVSRKCSHDEIKKAFYEKSKKLHPDLHNASAESTLAFVELKTAYDTLRRPADRRVYDHRDEMAERARERAAYRHAYRPSIRPEYYGGGGGWEAFFRNNPGRKPGGEENLSDSEIFKRREEQWKFIMKWTIIGAAAVILYNAGYVIQIRLREHRLSQLIESDEIAKSFLRQPEFRNRVADACEVDEIASLLKKDVDEAYRKKCEELRETKNPDEIREEYRWMRAVEDAGRYQRYREKKEQQKADRQAAAQKGEQS
ncbi:dnj-4, partial [Pristionchus pacificus]